jgi:predicted metal-dependent peptidase
MATAQQKLTSARTSLILDSPFFGALALSLIPREDTACDTAWTDGRNLGYNPTFIESLTHAELTGLIAHEVMHCAMGHPWRRDARDGKQFNVACDLAINGDLKDSGFSLPAGGLFPDKTQHGKSAEWIYARLPQPKPGKDKTGSGGQGTPQAGKGKPDPAGEVRDAPTGPDSDGTPAPTEGEWKQKTAEALQAAKMQGSLSGGLARKVEDALGKRIDVRSLLLRFMTERTKADYSWSQPNTRYLSQGLYLPALNSVDMGEVAIMVDTSGSVDSQSLAYARAIVEDVISECSPAAVTVWYSDAKVCKVDRFERGESLTWEPAGGGGTDFRPALKAIEEEGTAVCVLCITDLYGSFPDSCDLPVLWLATTDKVAPFGETIPLPQ